MTKPTLAEQRRNDLNRRLQAIQAIIDAGEKACAMFEDDDMQPIRTLTRNELAARQRLIDAITNAITAKKLLKEDALGEMTKEVNPDATPYR